MQCFWRLTPEEEFTQMMIEVSKFPSRIAECLKQIKDAKD